MLNSSFSLTINAVHIDKFFIFLTNANFRLGKLRFYPGFRFTRFPASTDPFVGYQLCTDNQEGVAPTELL